MDNLAHSEIFALTLVIGTYLTSLALYKKVHISLLHPLLTTIFVIIVVLEVLGIQYESFQQSSHLIHFMLGPSVVALGYVLYEQIQYLKGNVVSILTSVFVGAIVGIVSVIIIGKLMGRPSVDRHAPTEIRHHPDRYGDSGESGRHTFTYRRHRRSGRNLWQYSGPYRDEGTGNR